MRDDFGIWSSTFNFYAGEIARKIQRANKHKVYLYYQIILLALFIFLLDMFHWKT